MEAPGISKSSLKITCLYRLTKIEEKNYSNTSQTLKINHEWIRKPLELRKSSISLSTKAHGTVFTETSKKLNILQKDSLKSQNEILTFNQESSGANFEHAISKLLKKFSWSQSVMFWFSLDQNVIQSFIRSNYFAKIEKKIFSIFISFYSGLYKVQQGI
jgi:hypothetical protein